MPSIRQTAGMAAVICFFAMAIIGSLKGHSPATCCFRAVGGAVIAYVTISIAGRWVLAIVIDAIVSSKTRTSQSKEQERGGAD